MAQRYYFFNSTTNDRRKYQAQHLAEYFGSVLSSGLIHINDEPELLVNVETGTLNTVVDAGKALIKGHLYENTTPLTLEHSIPEANLDRIDRIVLRLDLRNSERNILLHVKEGVASSEPEPPELQRDEFIYELSLAQVKVRANTSSLDVDDLQDERLIDELCGLVQSMISLPTTRFQEQWDAFMDSVKGEGYATIKMLDDVEEELSERIDGIVEDYVRSPGYASASHSGNTYNVTLDPAPVEYKDGMGVVLKATNDTTGQPKINVNGLGTKSIYQSNGLEVPSFKANTVYTLRYNGSNFILQGESGGDEGESRALARLGLGLDYQLRAGAGVRLSHVDDLYYYVVMQAGVSSPFFYRCQKLLRSNGSIVSSIDLDDYTSNNPIDDNNVSFTGDWIIRNNASQTVVYDENGVVLFEVSLSGNVFYFDGSKFAAYETSSDSSRKLYKYDENGTRIESALIRFGLNNRSFLYAGSVKQADGQVLINYIYGRAQDNQHFPGNLLFNQPFPSDVQHVNNRIGGTYRSLIGYLYTISLFE